MEILQLLLIILIVIMTIMMKAPRKNINDISIIILVTANID